MVRIDDLTAEEIEALVTIALRGGKRRAHWKYKRFNALENKGLTQVVNRGQVYHTHRLTSAGIEAILALPDDYTRSFYPLSGDIARAKAVARKLAQTP